MQQLHFTREQVIKILEDYSIQTRMGLDVVSDIFRRYNYSYASWIFFREECIEASASERQGGGSSRLSGRYFA